MLICCNRPTAIRSAPRPSLARHARRRPPSPHPTTSTNSTSSAQISLLRPMPAPAPPSSSSSTSWPFGDDLRTSWQDLLLHARLAALRAGLIRTAYTWDDDARQFDISSIGGSSGKGKAARKRVRRVDLQARDGGWPLDGEGDDDMTRTWSVHRYDHGLSDVSAADGTSDDIEILTAQVRSSLSLPQVPLAPDPDLPASRDSSSTAVPYSTTTRTSTSPTCAPSRPSCTPRRAASASTSSRAPCRSRRPTKRAPGCAARSSPSRALSRSCSRSRSGRARRGASSCSRTTRARPRCRLPPPRSRPCSTTLCVSSLCVFSASLEHDLTSPCALVRRDRSGTSSAPWRARSTRFRAPSQSAGRKSAPRPRARRRTRCSLTRRSPQRRRQSLRSRTEVRCARSPCPSRRPALGPRLAVADPAPQRITRSQTAKLAALKKAALLRDKTLELAAEKRRGLRARRKAARAERKKSKQARGGT